MCGRNIVCEDIKEAHCVNQGLPRNKKVNTELKTWETSFSRQLASRACPDNRPRVTTANPTSQLTLHFTTKRKSLWMGPTTNKHPEKRLKNP